MFIHLASHTCKSQKKKIYHDLHRVEEISNQNTLHEVPVGFSVAMSCVLANRLVLNVRKMGKGVEVASRSPRMNFPEVDKINTIASFATPGRLTIVEMDQLRMMRAETPFSDL